MTDLADWLHQNNEVLVAETVSALSGADTQKDQVVETVRRFYRSLTETASHDDLAPLYAVLQDWIAARSAPTEGELTRIVPVLTTIKGVNVEQIRRRCSPVEAVGLLTAADAIYSPAVAYLSQLETDALLADMRTQLYEARQQLERLEKSKTDFVAVAAHELRTPITLVEGYTSIIRSTYRTFAEDQVGGTLLDGIDGGIRRLREIISDMIDVSLISLEMLELHLQPTWLPQIMDALERSLRPTLRERALELVLDRDTIPRRPMYADPERLLQVFHKIVANAIKFTPDGGRIEIRGRELTGFVDITVTDNGIGISANDLQHIFGMFSTLADPSLHSSGKTKFRGGGPGLGLFISKGIVEAHGGNIWAESPGFNEETCPGSAFHILIPMRSAPQDDNISEVFASGN
jgi:signal transduction histidine kinase